MDAHIPVGHPQRLLEFLEGHFWIGRQSRHDGHTAFFVNDLVDLAECFGFHGLVVICQIEVNPVKKVKNSERGSHHNVCVNNPRKCLVESFRRKMEHGNAATEYINGTKQFNAPRHEESG